MLFRFNSFEKNELRYSFLSHNDWSHLPHTMLSFRVNERETDCKKGLFSFCRTECEEQSLEYYRDSFWKVLQYLHENDNQAWPKQIPEDPDHYLWEFSFGGEPIFAFGNAPAYKQRKTRHLGILSLLGFSHALFLMD